MMRFYSLYVLIIIFNHFFLIVNLIDNKLPVLSCTEEEVRIAFFLLQKFLYNFSLF